ncbi:MAG: rhodanese-like domain-containing protein [Candidatus Dormibacteria bacterium]
MPLPVTMEVEVDRARRLIAEGAPVLDVREAHERAKSRIGGSLWIPVTELSRRWRELPRDGVLVVQCAAGSRSFRATKFLREQGIMATSLIGGISEWEAHGLPTVSDRKAGPAKGAVGAPSGRG